MVVTLIFPTNSVFNNYILSVLQNANETEAYNPKLMMLETVPGLILLNDNVCLHTAALTKKIYIFLFKAVTCGRKLS